MRLEIENVLGMERADLEIPVGGVVEVIGANAAGKSSVATAVQALAAREVNPLGVPAPQAKRVYVRDGEENGEATLSDEGLIVTWRPHSQTIEAPNDQPHSRPEAVGLVDYTAKTGAKQRTEQLQGALLPDPSEIMEAIRSDLSAYLDVEDLTGVMEMIGQRGWDAAASVYSDRARQAKRAWQDITGRQWGIKVGSDWRPAGWLADYDHLTPQQAEERVVSARDALSALHEVQAVSQMEADQANEAKASVPHLTDLVKQAMPFFSLYSTSGTPYLLTRQRRN